MLRRYTAPTALLVAAAFLTTGALTTVTNLVEPYSVWAVLAVSGVWALLMAAGRLPSAPADRRVLWASGGVAALGVASAVASGHAVYSVFYDSYAYLPLIVWLAMLGAFVLASMIPIGGDVRRGLVLSLLIAAAPMAQGFVQGAFGGTTTAFGNSNYFVSVVMILAVVALGVARTSPTARARVAWRLYGLFAVLAVLAQRTLIGFIAVPFVLLVISALDPSLLHDRLSIGRGLRVAAALVAGAGAVALLLASVPLLSGWAVTPQRAGLLGPNVEARLDLWSGAQRMFAERPILGYGPGGYKLASAGYAGPAAYRVAAVTDPLAVSPPSPHSLVWVALTSIGLLGAVALAVLGIVWVLVVRERQAADRSLEARSFRLSLAIAFGAFLLVVSTVPISVAQGLLPAVIAGLALASPVRGERDAPRSRVGGVMLVLSGVVVLVLAAGSLLAYVAYATMDSGDFVQSTKRFALIRRLQPDDPRYRYREFEYRLLNAASAEEAAQVRGGIDGTGGVIASHAPGLVGLAALSLDEGAQHGRRDYSWERETLARARQLSPYFPTLVAEELHLAAMEGDKAALERALAAARADTSGHPLLRSYIARAESMIGTGTP